MRESAIFPLPVNTFIVSSTWLTVAMAVSRYVGICHPLHARQIIGRTFATLTLLGVFVISVLANVPRFLRQQIGAVPCREGGHFYFAELGWLTHHPTADRAYQVSVSSMYGIIYLPVWILSH